MDITRTTEPRSDQLNFDDVQTHDLVITVTEVKRGNPEQPVELHNAEHPGRPYKPGKSMRRVLIAAWGAEASVYVGRRIRLYGDPTIKFGKDAVGGIRIRALSDIPSPLTVALTVTRGKRAPYTVQPLESGPARDWLAELEQTDGDADLISGLGRAARAGGASAEVMDAITAAYRAAQEASGDAHMEGQEQ